MRNKPTYIRFNKKTLDISCSKCHSKKLSWIPCLTGWICLKCKTFNNAIGT